MSKKKSKNDKNKSRWGKTSLSKIILLPKKYLVIDSISLTLSILCKRALVQPFNVGKKAEAEAEE